MRARWVARPIVDRVLEVATERGVPRRRLESILAPGEQPSSIAGERAHALWAHVVRELGDPGVAWDVAARARPGEYGPLGFAIQASDTLGDALARAARYFASVTNAAEIALSIERERATILVRRKDGAQSIGARLGTEYIAAQVVQLVGAITGGRARPRAVRLAHAAHAETTRALPAVTTYGARVTAIELERAALATPLPRRDPDLVRHFEDELERRCPRVRRASVEVRDTVERALLSGGAISEDAIARALDTSARTLRRRLSDEGTTVRATIDSVRLERACERLLRDDASLAAIAFELGFSDQTAFSRAFRRWTGTTPGEHRRLARRRS